MSTIEDFPSTTFAALPHEDLTVAEAWASSPLGDPTIEDGSPVQPVESEDSPATTVIAKPRSWGTNALVAGAVVAALGAVAGLGLLLIDGSGPKEQKPAVVAPNASVGSVQPQAPSAVAPPPSAPAPADAAQVSPGPVSRGDAPVAIVPAPPPAAAPAGPPAPADPGPPPPPPNVTVNVPPVIVPVPVPVPVPPQQGGSQQGGGQPAPSGGSGHGPIQCFACHPPQPVHPQPIHPQPIQPQPIRLQPLQHP